MKLRPEEWRPGMEEKPRCLHKEWKPGPFGIRTKQLTRDDTGGYYLLVDAKCETCGEVFLKRISEE